MTLTAELAARALAPADERARDHLRALTLCNIAAACGDLGRTGELIARVTRDGGATEAARVSAMRLHARTQDDFFPFGRVHVGATTLACALALADEARDRLLDCLAAGYDVMCRVSSAYSDIAQRRGMRPTGIFGPLGAAATAAVALGLDTDGVANAIGLAAIMSAGTNQAWLSGTDEWLLELGAAARSGVEAAQLTLAGAVASPHALEGAAGWARAYFDDDGERLGRAIESDRSPLLDVAVKPYPVSGIAQVPTWLACRAHADLATSEPERIELGLSAEEAAYPGSANRGPFRSRSDALMSLAFCVACGVRDGLVRLEQLERPNDTTLAALIERFTVTVREDVGESEATLAVVAGGRRSEWRGSGTEILFPRWEDIDTDAVAARSEADVAVIRDAHAELMRDAPDAIAFTALLEEPPCPAGFNPSNAASTS